MVREKSLSDTNFLLFNVLKEKHVFFQGLVWRPHHLVLELVEICNLYQVTVQTEESFNSGQNPDEVFLLQSVEHVITGEMTHGPPSNSEKLMFAKFVFRSAAQ